MRLDPKVIEEAMLKTECSSADEFGWKYIGKSGTTVRNYLSGKSIPTLRTAMVLKRITGRTLDQMVIEEANEIAA
ncbi:hypothetical protein FRC0418_00610 [Corynebacterium diphtheriae]|nr:hypothetical protein FRC0418_00610 [Corynebacterium diphtheriae]CAB0942331.1 hypothetical protein FRC0448_00583 [Corynebacterium diphtheriae]